MKKFIFPLFILILVSCQKGSSSNPKTKASASSTPGSGVTDVNGKTYKTIKIGKQEWMAENLDVTTYNDKTPIKESKHDLEWMEHITQWLGFKEAVWHNRDGLIQYGKIYNGYVVESEKKVCPTGWHIPSKIEWETLINTVGGEQDAGTSLKQAGYQNWKKTNWSNAYDTATNSSGFTAIPNVRVSDGMYVATISAWYWTSDLTMISIDNESPFVGINDDKEHLTDAAAIRCIKN